MQPSYTILCVENITIGLIGKALKDISTSGHLNEVVDFFIFIRKIDDKYYQIWYTGNTHEDKRDIYLSGKYTKKIIEQETEKIALEILNILNV